MTTISDTAETGRFLCDYAACLLRSGATCIRLEKNVQRMAERWHLNAALTIMPRNIHLSVCTRDGGESTMYMSPAGPSAISYDIVARLSRLSWDVADGTVDVGRARSILAETERTPAAGKWWVLLAVSFANASFCRLFGGDCAAMAIVFFATMAGYYVKQTMLAAHADARIVFAVCAFISSVLGATGSLFSIGSTPEIAIATSVLYLVPGIPFLNAFSDMLDRHYICFFSRMTDAVILTCCLSLGLCSGMSLMRAGMF